MKRLISIIMGISIIAVQMMFSSEPAKTISAEKKAQAIEAAVKVCDVMAPGYDMSGLAPMVQAPVDMQFPDEDYEVSKRLVDKKIVTVNFMKDTTKCCSFMKCDKATNKSEIVRRPMAEVVVALYYDTMEPVSFYPPGHDNEGYVFYPSYKEFLNTHRYENGLWKNVSDN